MISWSPEGVENPQVQNLVDSLEIGVDVLSEKVYIYIYIYTINIYIYLLIFLLIFTYIYLYFYNKVLLVGEDTGKKRVKIF